MVFSNSELCSYSLDGGSSHLLTANKCFGSLEYNLHEGEEEDATFSSLLYVQVVLEAEEKKLSLFGSAGILGTAAEENFSSVS